MVALARLRSVRQRNALTQQELAERAGVNRVTIARLEGGVDEPRPATIRKLASALGVEPVTLIGRLAQADASGELFRRARRSSSSVSEPKPAPPSRQSSPPLAGRLAGAEDERVRRVLKKAPGLATLIGEAVDQLMRVFPDARLKLQAMTDPEFGGSDELFLGVLTSLPHGQALRALRRFDEGWWLNHVGQARGLLCINLAYGEL